MENKNEINVGRTNHLIGISLSAQHDYWKWLMREGAIEKKIFIECCELLVKRKPRRLFEGEW